MNNSNYTLRFSRTGREAYGYDVSFNDKSDKLVWGLFVFGLGFILGLLIP